MITTWLTQFSFLTGASGAGAGSPGSMAGSIAQSVYTFIDGATPGGVNVPGQTGGLLCQSVYNWLTGASPAGAPVPPTIVERTFPEGAAHGGGGGKPGQRRVKKNTDDGAWTKAGEVPPWLPKPQTEEEEIAILLALLELE